MKSLFKQGSAAVLAALVALLALSATGTAQAAVYRGVFDPTYGPAFPGLGWRGEALFNVPGNCGVTIETVVKSNDPDCNANGLAYVQEASVRFYDINNDTVDIAEIAWGPYADEVSASGNDANVFTLSFVDGALDQLRAALSFQLPQAVGQLSDPQQTFFKSFSSSYFSLSFVLALTTCDIDPLSNDGCGEEEDYAGLFYSGPLLTSGVCVEEQGCKPETFSNVFVNRPTFVITQVPEPGTLALVAAALIAGGSLRVRRRSR